MTRTIRAAVAFGALLFSVPAHAGDGLTFSVASGLADKHTAVAVFRTRFQQEMDRHLEQSGGPAVHWREFHAGTLAQLGGVLEAVEDDLAMFGIVSVNSEYRRLPVQDMTFRMPFMTERCEVVADAYHMVHRDVEGMTGPFRAARQAYLAPVASDSYNFIAVQKIANGADIRGVPMAVTERIEGWLSGVSGAPVPLRADMIVPRIEAEVLVGAVLPTTEMRRLNIKQVADHFTRTGLGSQVPYVLTVNSRMLADLPDAVREGIRKTAEAFVLSAARDYCEAGVKSLEHLERRGIHAAKLLKSRRIQWAAALAPLAQTWAKSNDEAGYPGTQAVEAYVEHVAASGVRLTRDWSLPAQPGELPKFTPDAGQVSEARRK